jgi:hypothetical protein
LCGFAEQEREPDSFVVAHGLIAAEREPAGRVPGILAGRNPDAADEPCARSR